MPKKKKINPEDNVTIRKKDVEGNEEFIKLGNPLDHIIKQSLPPRTIGMSKGITKNMGDYESLRIDVWLVDYIQDNETIEEASMRLSDIIDATLVRIVEKTLEEL